jgi:hypothetical protein
VRSNLFARQYHRYGCDADEAKCGVVMLSEIVKHNTQIPKEMEMISFCSVSLIKLIFEMTSIHNFFDSNNLLIQRDYELLKQ